MRNSCRLIYTRAEGVGCLITRCVVKTEGDPKVNQIFKEITDCKFKE